MWRKSMSRIDLACMVRSMCIYWGSAPWLRYLVSVHLSILFFGSSLILQPILTKFNFLILSNPHVFTQTLQASGTWDSLPTNQELGFFSLQINFYVCLTLHTHICKCLSWLNLGLLNKRDHCIFLLLPQCLSVCLRNERAPACLQMEKPGNSI